MKETEWIIRYRIPTAKWKEDSLKLKAKNYKEAKAKVMESGKIPENCIIKIQKYKHERIY